jgi:nicotinamide-nucleotide amidase
MELKKKILEHLSEYVYADDETSLEEHVISLLEGRGVTLALAEEGSGGSLAAALSEADSEHRVLVGAYIAPTIEKLWRLLGVQNDNLTDDESRTQQIEQLARATADAAESQLAIAVSEAWRDENGTAYVYVAFKLSDGRIESRKVRLSGSGELARSRLCTQLLDQLRRLLR